MIKNLLAILLVCPIWITGSSECWCPVVTYKHNLTQTQNQTPVYVTRIEWLCNQGQMFSTRKETEDYIESGAIKGLWEFDAIQCGPEAKCRWVPNSAFEKIDLVQIIHPEGK